jgi:lipoprotein-anchoring transpeptidase ErfK/SrfK
MKTFAKIIAAAAIVTASAVSFATPSQAAFGIFSAFQTQPKIVAKVSISEQKMYLDVTKDGYTQSYVWKVSTGKSGFETPTGSYQPTWLSKNHVSKTYDDAPMPFAVFFTGGYAVHATDAVGRLGKPASHGCVRLAPQNAAAFFQLVSAYGKWNTSIVIVQ